MGLSALSATAKAVLTFTSTLAAASKATFKQQDDVEAGTLAFPSLSLSFGASGANVNQAYVDSRTLAASGSDMLNFSGGSATAGVALKNPNGEAAITMSKIFVLMIWNKSTTDTLHVGGNATYDIAALFNGARNKPFTVRPGQCAAFICSSADTTGIAVATNEALLITNDSGSNALTYEIWALGQI